LSWIIANHPEQKTLQATTYCFRIRINLDTVVVFLHSCSPISVDYSGKFEEVLLESHQFLQVLFSWLEIETL
jgi:hypothetical protein